MASMSTVLGLEQARKRAGVSLQEISDTTKISPLFLRAIETEEFDKLPGGVFDTNYMRQYAAAIEYPEAKLFECYKAHVAAKEREQNAIQPVHTPRRWSIRVLEWLTDPSPRNS